MVYDIRIRLKDMSIASLLKVKTTLEQYGLQFEERWERDYDENGQGPSYLALTDMEIIKSRDAEIARRKGDKNGEGF